MTSRKCGMGGHIFDINKNEKIYVYVGEYGMNENEVFNNGGKTNYIAYINDVGYGYSGGGAQTYYSLHVGGAGGGSRYYDRGNGPI